MNNHIPTAQLWFGTAEVLQHHAKKYIKNILCRHNNCAPCSDCQHVEQKQHASLLWVRPEKQYTLELLEPVKHALAFALEEKQHFFIVLESADLMSPACANSLLKIIEEPPQGYHFILLAYAAHAILPTIQSRCLIKNFITRNTTLYAHDIVYALTAPEKKTAFEFLQILEKSPPDDGMSLTLLEQVLAYWLEQYTISVVEDNEAQHIRATAIVAVLQKALLQTPMPGSSKIFWKNVFLQGS